MHVWVLSHVQLFVILRTVAYLGPLSMEFCRQEYWSAYSLSLLQGLFLTQGWKNAASLLSESPGKPIIYMCVYIYTYIKKVTLFLAVLCLHFILFSIHYIFLFWYIKIVTFVSFSFLAVLCLQCCMLQWVGAPFQLQCVGFSSWWLFLLWSADSGKWASIVVVLRISGCGAWA